MTGERHKVESPLEVWGTVKADQATQAGEAVVLGSDGKVPARLVPDQSVDLSGYYTKVETDNLLDDKADVSDLASYYTQTQVNGLLGGYVPQTRKVNNKALSSDISLSAGDVGAVPTSRKVNGKPLSSDVTLTASDVGAAPTEYTFIGNGSVTSFTVTHNKGRLPTFTLYKMTGSQGELYITDAVATTTTIVFTFASAPATADTFKVVYY